MKTLLLVITLLVPSITLAQQQGVIAEPPALTDVEKLKLEKAALIIKISEMTKEIGQWRSMASQCLVPLSQYEAQAQDTNTKDFLDKLVKEIEDARPGFSFDPQTGKFSLKPEPKK